MSQGRDSAAPLVSITSAFYNTGPVLIEMIESVLAQTYPNWELVLLDDGSTDDSRARVEALDDPRIRVHANDRNRGRSYSLNRLTQLAQGDFIARMDSDDLASPTRIEKQVAFLQAHPRVDIVGTGMIYLDESGAPVGKMTARGGHEFICQDPVRYFRIAHGTILGRRGWFERFRYDESLTYSVDMRLFLESYRDSCFDNVAEPLYYYRLAHSFSLSKQWQSRRAMARHGFEECRRAGRPLHGVLQWGMKHLKFGIAVAMVLLGQKDRLLRQRFEPLGADELRHYAGEVEQFRASAARRTTPAVGNATPCDPGGAGAGAGTA
jgi:glycosyltransferase involved in cell wall biosynthesis